MPTRTQELAMRFAVLMRWSSPLKRTMSPLVATDSIEVGNRPTVSVLDGVIVLFMHFLAVRTQNGLSINSLKIFRRRVMCSEKPCHRPVCGLLPPFFSRKVR